MAQGLDWLPDDVTCMTLDRRTGSRIHKRTYDKRGAKLAIKGIKATNGRTKAGKLVAYPCRHPEFPGRWHVGHSSTPKQREEY